MFQPGNAKAEIVIFTFKKSTFKSLIVTNVQTHAHQGQL